MSKRHYVRYALDRPALPSRTRRLALSALAATIALAGCRGVAPSFDASAAASPAAEPAKTQSGVHLDASQLKQIRIEELSPGSRPSTIKATGTIEFNADRMAKLLPPVSGQVQDLAVNSGDTVRSNDVLFVLSSREAAAAVADHLASHKDLELAQKTFAMTKDLYEHQAASRMALEQSESELAKARSKVKQTEEVLEVLGLDPDAEDDLARVQPRIPVRTPIEGTVIERSVTNGQFVSPETSPLMTIADLSSVWVQGDIFERDLRFISIGQKADVTTAAFPSDRFSAKVSRIGSVVDAQTHTAKVRFLVANRGARLKPGMFASINLYLSDDAAALTVPAKAVFVENGQTFAYVQSGPQDFVRRHIETAASGSERLRVVRGVITGDRVVSDGVLLVRQLEADSSQP
jgi:cobalt-zinc-cadmium efflux system membrane fusion protein